MVFDIRDYGAVADGKTLNTSTIQQAIDACGNAGGGRVLVEGGTYMTGKLLMRSRVELHIAAGAVLLGSPRCEDYPESTDEEASHVNTSLLPRRRNACMIFANECEDIAITGMGTINGNGTHFVVPVEPYSCRWQYRRIDAPTPPRVVFFTGCRNVKVTDITMTDQPAGWSYWIHDCDYVAFDRVKILADVHFPNNDGIHINCSRNVTVSNCDITCGDDCVIVRANNVSLPTGENKVCEKVAVTNCNLTSYASGIRIGWINDGVIRDCTFSNLVMTDTLVGIALVFPYLSASSSSDIGREASLVENLSFSDIIMDGSVYPIKVRIDDHPDVHINKVRRLYFRGIRANSIEFPFLSGTRDHIIEDVRFSDCSFRIYEPADCPHFDVRGSEGNYHYDGKQHTMLCNHTRGIMLDSVTFDVY